MDKFPQLLPPDENNAKLESYVRPADWRNPHPKGRYNLVVIGAGTAGLVTAAGAAGLGAKVALIERSLMGGDCLNVGCVPSKAIISAGRVAATVRSAERFGIRGTEHAHADFGQVMARMRQLRADISPNDSAARFRNLGVDVYFGQAMFEDSQTVDVDGTKLNFAKAVIATGARAAIPTIPGLDSVPFLTNETVFSLTELPKRLGIIGAGPIGCELAQAFAQLGSQVVLVESESGILPREDRDAAAIVRVSLIRDGVRLLPFSSSLSVEARPTMALTSNTISTAYREEIDQLLVCVGRSPNVENMNLELVGVKYNAKGVVVDDFMRTTNHRIFAAGDICSPFQFTHAADFMARIVIQNALFLGRKRASSLMIPWCTYTSPEVAHVGLYEAQARDKGLEIDTYVQQLAENDRAILEGDTEGFVKIHVLKGKDRIVGATIVAKNAGDQISEVTLAMTNRVGLKKIGTTIHPYPTQAEAIRRVADQYNRTRLTPLVKSLFQRWLDWTR